MSGRGGRPRDPQVDVRVVLAAVDLLSSTGRLNADDIAGKAVVGKASIYRRWATLEGLLVDVVRSLGVRPVDHGDGPGDLHADLTRVLHAATTGSSAAAERAVLSQVGRSTQLQVAYMAGPTTRLIQAVNDVEVRGRRRDEPEWPSIAPVLAAFRLLQATCAVDGEEPNLLEVAAVVESVALPGLAAVSA